jgi:transposase-like protein
MHPGHHRREAEGKKELVGFTDGLRERSQSWRDLLLDLRRRGLTTAPQIAVADGALGFWTALGEVWPAAREQCCWVHKTAITYRVLQSENLPKAAHPADSPAQQPSEFEFESRVAREISVQIPPAILARADEVIEWRLHGAGYAIGS